MSKSLAKRQLSSKRRLFIIAWIFLIAFILSFGAAWLVNIKQKPTITKTTTDSESTVQAKLISPAEFAEMAQDPEVFIVDVHTPEQTHIAGTDAVIPDTQIVEQQALLPTDKSTPILVYCRSGSMSRNAAQEIIKLGYENVYDLEGGTNAYKEQQVSVQMWPAEQDLGTVVYGNVATTSFTITNYTPLPTKITRVSTSCGCTSAEVVKEELGAYESTQVNVSFDPAVHKDDTDLGELARTIYVETDNPNFSDLESIITANVIKQ